jgi:hypothetical protein
MWLWVVAGFYLGGLIVPMVRAGLPFSRRPSLRLVGVRSRPVRT